MPRVELAAVDHDLLRTDIERAEAPSDRGIQLRTQKGDEVARRILGDRRERVARDDLRQLVARAHEDVHLKAEPRLELPFEVSLELRPRRATLEDHVAALQERAHVLVAALGQEPAQRGHLHAPRLAEVDPAQEDDARRHVVGSTSDGTIARSKSG